MRGDDRGLTTTQVVGVVLGLVVVVAAVGVVLVGDGPGGMFVMMLLLAPAIIGLGLWYQHHRTKLAQQWAARVGWRFVGTDHSLASRWYGAPFGVGRSRRTSEVVTGSFQGRPAVSFGYRYTTGSGKNQSTYTFHVVAIELPAYLPTLELTPDGLGAKIAKGLGGQDIQLESEQFNDAWRVEAPSAKFAHDVVNPRLMHRLLAPDAQGLSLRIEGTSILCWTRGNPDYPGIARRLQVMCAIADGIPRFVWLDHGYDPARAS